MIELNVRGLPLWIHDNEALSNHIKNTGDFFEAEILDYIRDNFGVQQTIIDVGANIGNHTVYFASFLEWKEIYAFEPITENFDILTKNCGITNPKIGRSAVAISDRGGSTRITPHLDNMGTGEITDDGEREVPCFPLDYFRFQNVTFIKIDVEWHEPYVLRGAKQTIQQWKPLILIEDTHKEYDKLIPDYELIKGWDNHKTYLYGWKH